MLEGDKPFVQCGDRSGSTAIAAQKAQRIVLRPQPLTRMNIKALSVGEDISREVSRLQTRSMGDEAPFELPSQDRISNAIYQREHRPLFPVMRWKSDLKCSRSCAQLICATLGAHPKNSVPITAEYHGKPRRKRYAKPRKSNETAHLALSSK